MSEAAEEVTNAAEDISDGLKDASESADNMSGSVNGVSESLESASENVNGSFWDGFKQGLEETGVNVDALTTGLVAFGSVAGTTALAVGGMKTELELVKFGVESALTIFSEFANTLVNVAQAVYNVALECASARDEIKNMISNETYTNLEEFSKASDNASNAILKLKTDVISGMLPGLTQLTNGFAEAAAGSQAAAKDISQGFDKLSSGVKTSIKTLTDRLGSIAEIFSDEGVNGAIEFIRSFKDSLINNIPEIVDSLSSIVDGLMEFAPELMEAGLDIVVAIVESLAEHLPEMLPKIMEAVIALVSSLVEHAAEIVPPLMSALIELVKSLGEMIPELIPVIIEGLFAIVDGIIEALPELIPALVEALVEIAAALIEYLPDIILGILEAIGKLIYELLGPLVDKCAEVGGELLDAMAEGFMNNVENFKSSVSNTVDTVVDKIKSIVEKVKQIGRDIVDGLMGGFNSNKDVLNSIGDILNNAIDKLKNAVSKVKEIGKNIIDGLAGALNFQKISDRLEEIKNNIVEKIQSWVNYFKDLGRNIVDGMTEGIKDKMQSAINAVSQFGQNILDTIKKILNINSPSKEFAWIAEMCIAGLENKFSNYDADGLFAPIQASLSNLQANVSGGMSYGMNSAAQVDNHVSVYLEGDAKGLFNVIQQQNDQLVRATGYHALG